MTLGGSARRDGASGDPGAAVPPQRRAWGEGGPAGGRANMASRRAEPAWSRLTIWTPVTARSTARAGWATRKLFGSSVERKMINVLTCPGAGLIMICGMVSEWLRWVG